MFRLSLVDELIETYRSSDTIPKRGRPSLEDNPNRLIEMNFLRQIPSTDKKRQPPRECKVCCSKRDENNKRCRKETGYYCPDCDVGLCISCFEIYHTRKNY